KPHAGGAIAAYVSVLVTDAVHRGDVYAVGDGVRALDGLARLILCFAEWLLLRWMPTNRRGIEEQVCTAESGDARRFGIPLIPADERAHLPNGGIEGLEAEIPGGEIKLLVI